MQNPNSSPIKESPASPSWFRGFLAIARLSLEQQFRNRRALLLALLAALPPALAVGAVSTRSFLPSLQLSNNAVYQISFTLLYANLLILLAPLLCAVNLIAEEVENHSLVCLLTRPIPKSVILAAKFAGYIALSSAILCTSLVLDYTILYASRGSGWLVSSLPDLGRDLAVVEAGLLVYGALFTLFGLLFKRSLLVGLLYAFVWESTMAYVPGVLHQLTVLHHLQSMSRWSFQEAAILSFLGERTSMATAQSFLALAFVGISAIGILVFQHRQYGVQRQEV